jgi:methionyl-tRNA synthetase
LQTWSSGEFEDGRTFYREKFDHFRPGNAFSAPLRSALACNALVEISAPWNLAKDYQQEKLLDAVLYHLAESLRVIAIWISPVLPRGAHGIFDQLNWKMKLNGKEDRFSLADVEWGRLPDGHVVGKPVPLFPRIER